MASISSSTDCFSMTACLMSDTVLISSCAASGLSLAGRFSISATTFSCPLIQASKESFVFWIPSSSLSREPREDMRPCTCAIKNRVNVARIICSHYCLRSRLEKNLLTSSTRESKREATALDSTSSKRALVRSLCFSLSCCSYNATRSSTGIKEGVRNQLG